MTLPGGLVRSATIGLSPDVIYRFRVRARDRVGNWSAWTPGPTIRARVRQEGSSVTTWSAGWSRVSDAALSGGGGRTSTATGETARIVESARAVAVVARRGPGRGQAQIWVDGALATTIDLGAPVLGSRSIVFGRTWGSTARHTVTVRNLGTSGRPLVEVDAFLVIR